MSLKDFLFEGKPPKSVTTYGETVEGMPKWLSDYTQGLVARANAIAAEPYIPYEGPRIAGFSPDQLAAFEATRSGVGQWSPYLTGALDLMQAGGGASPLGTAAPVLDQAQTTAQQAISAPGALSMASPYLESAARTFPGAVDEYMNPYVSNVIDRASTLAKRALEEKFLPSVTKTFGSAGHDTRSTQMRETVDRGIRDLTEGIHEQSQAALADAYRTAGQMFGQDASRMGALASTVGQLAQGDRAQTLQGADLLRALGATRGSLAGQEGALQLEAGRGMGALSELLQAMGLRDAAALESIGASQQGQEQRSLDLAYQDFLEQRDFPRQNINWMSEIIRGLPQERTIQQSQTGPAEIYRPSGLSQLASAAAAAAGIWDLFKGRKEARGGLVRKYSKGGALRYAYS